MTRKQLYAAGAVALGLVGIYFLLRASKSKTPPAVPGTVMSGSQSVQIDTNVLSPTFGLPITLN